MDINLCIEKLGLSANSYRLSQSIPPHQIIEWFGPDPQPSESELAAVWQSVEYDLKAAVIREKRGRLLSETDWVALRALDASFDGQGIQLPAAWVSYRQALRDITQQSDFPDSVAWPEVPDDAA